MKEHCDHHNHNKEVSPHEETKTLKDNKDKVYTCPMHPEVVQDNPGMCPECGMALVSIQKSKLKNKNPEHNTDKHEGHSTGTFLKKFWINLVLTIPILLYSELPELFFGWEAPAFFGSQYLGLILGSIIFFYGGWIFLTGALREIQGRLPGMMTLIGVAITTAYLWSLYAVFAGVHPLFWELATLVTIMLLGHWIEMKAVQSARGALKALAKLLPDEAEIVISGSKTKKVKISDLNNGDIVIIKPGARIPADGVVIEGSSEVDESIITGESKPVWKSVEDEVVAGTINGDGGMKVKVTRTGDETFLAGVMRLVKEAESSKSRLQLLSDRAALYLTILALGAGGITFITWLFFGAEISFAVARLVAVLVIACPHALGLAVPLVASISTNMAADRGFIVKKRLALESAREVDTVLFDKTGTLTKGEFGVASIFSDEGKEEGTLRLGAAVNKGSEHSIAKALVKEAENRDLNLPEVSDFNRIPGKGASGIVEGTKIFVGSRELVKEKGLSIKEGLSSNISKSEKEGKTVIFVFSENSIIGAVALADIIREESKESIKALHKEGIKVAMITGDSEDVAKWVAKELDIDEYRARVLPEDKVAVVKEFQEKGDKVAFVGDGVNDAPALTQADLGIAIGAGTNVAIESAGIILAKNDPRDIPNIIDLSKLTYRKMMQNLFWATIYNVAALPLAAGVLYSQGVVLEPAVAAVFMSASTVIVAVNAMLMKRIK